MIGNGSPATIRLNAAAASADRGRGVDDAAADADHRGCDQRDHRRAESSHDAGDRRSTSPYST